jgi:hypothetical protein
MDHSTHIAVAGNKCVVHSLATAKVARESHNLERSALVVN